MPVDWWPEELPTPSFHWQPKNVLALRALVRYLCGLRAASQMFPAADISPTNIDNFKRNRTDFAYLRHGGKSPQLDMVRSCIFEVISADLNEDLFNHDCVEYQLKILFGADAADDTDLPSPEELKKRRLAAASNGLYALTGVSRGDTERYTPVACGVYHLYRCGDREHGEREIARSAVRIRSWGADRLIFDMQYYAVDGDTREGVVYGLVMPHSAGFFSLAGIDVASTDSPCLYIFHVGSFGRPSATFRGMMLRVNTRRRIVAARVLLHRQSEIGYNVGMEKVDPLFVEAANAVKLLTSEDEINGLRRAIPDLDVWINNKVDNKRRYVLLDTNPRPIVPIAEKSNTPKLKKVKKKGKSAG